MSEPQIVSREDWLTERKSLLEREKAFTRERDALSAARRGLPWVKVEKAYAFDTADGSKTLAELFGDKSQLVIYHFMLGPDWETGCKSCSFWADNFNGIDVHLAQRDVAFMAISRAPLEKVDVFKKRMGWSFDWHSSAPSDFNLDYQASYDPEQLENGTAIHNYRPLQHKMDEMAGISVFAKNDAGEVFHTYSTYSRGLDMMNGAYNYLDLVPKGRDEADLPFTMGWLKHHDSY